MNLTTGASTLVEASVGNLESINPFVIISGTGGSGKSMMMRHVLLNALFKTKRVPVFMELRELNQTSMSLREFVQHTLRSNHFDLDNEYIDKALKAGHFLLLFDGFDEIASSIRKRISKELIDLAKQYEKNMICVSSRPDNEFSGWSAFTVFRIQPLGLDQACQLIEKLPFDSDLKGKFLVELQHGLFEQHESFLSNPLLLSIMLLTYGQSADIPSKLSVFYNQAYEALFQRHDALKGGFQRTRQSNLDIQDFARVFAAFSIQTYDKRLFHMSRSDALKYLEQCKKILQIHFDVNHYLHDAEQAVCLLVEEGLLIGFSHRSFQEYFVARFICESSPSTQEKLIDKYQRYLFRDSVLELLTEMNPQLIERCLIISGLERLQKQLKITRKVGISHFVRYLKSEVITFEFRDDDIVGIPKPGAENVSLVRFVLQHWGTTVDYDPDSYAGFGGFSKKYDTQDKRRTVNVANLTYKDEFVKDLSALHGTFSIYALQSALKIKDALIKKHREIGATLDDILLR
jgi:predicted NACHT family NTPase